MSVQGQHREVFYEIPCLTEHSATLSGTYLIKKFFRSADRRYLGQTLQKFVSYNSELFRFLGVQPYLLGNDQSSAIAFRTTSFIGAIPLRAPDTGKQIGDFVVSPRFVGRDRYEQYVEILDLLGSQISPEFVDSLRLASGRIFRPPLYLEAAKFITALEQLLKTSWRKFDNLQFVLNEPAGQVDWNKYANAAYKVENRLRFPTRKNILSEIHEEYSQLRYVFDICKSELQSRNAPSRIRALFKTRLMFIENKLYLHKPEITESITIRAADSRTVRACKEQANIILKRDLVDGTAWRVDSNEVFERFVQHIFAEVAKTIGGKLHTNPKISARSLRRHAWELSHIEPDAVIRKDDFTIFVDAKYKSNLYNKSENTDLLKEDFRRDLHQILAYTSFSETRQKLAVICYPSNEIESKTTDFRNALNDASTKVLIVGIPLKRSIISDAVRHVATSINEYTRAAL